MAERRSRTPVKKTPVSQRLNFSAKKKESEWDTSHGNLEVNNHAENKARSIGQFLDPNEVLSTILEYLIINNFINFMFTKCKCKMKNQIDSDLVFICEKEGKTTISLARIINKNSSDKISFKNLTENDGTGFQLSKYYDWFRQLKDHIWFDDEVKYSDVGELILCTNVDFEDDLNFFSKVDIKNENNDVKFCKLNLKDTGSKKLLFPNEYITEQDKLAKELVYCIMFDNLNYLFSENPYRFLKKYKTFLLEEVFSSVTNGFSDIFLSGNLKLHNLDVFKFRQIFIKELNSFFSNFTDISSLETKTGFKFQFREKTLEFINKQIRIYNEINVLEFLRNFSFNFPKYFSDKDNDAIKIFPSKNMDSLQVDKEIDQFLNFLTFAVKVEEKTETRECNIDNNVQRFLKHELNNLVEGKWIRKESLMLNVLDKPVSFKGKNICLNQIINISNLDSPKILSEIFCKEFPSKLGKEISIKEDISYIPHKLMHSMAVQTDILKLNKTDIFVIFIKESDVNYFQGKFTDKDESFVNIAMGMKKSIRLYYIFGKYNIHFLPFINSECNAIVSNSDELDYITETNIHFLNYDNGCLKWNHTIGDFDKIRNYFTDFENELSLNELDCVEEQRFIIINGRFGIGKSALLDNVTRTSMELKLNSKSLWICRIDLWKCDKLLEIKFAREKTSLSDAYEFIYHCENIKDDISKIVFKHFLNDNRVVLLFDGFDELPDYCRDNVVELFECLKYHSNIKKIWTTSHPNLIGRLEDCFELNESYELKEFDKHTQIIFLVEQWMKKYKSCNDKILFNNACKLIQVVGITKSYYLSFGVPLYLLMLATVFEDEAYAENPIFPETLTLFELYEKYSNKIISALEYEIQIEDTEYSFNVSSKIFVTWQNEIISLAELKSIIEHVEADLKKLVIWKLNLILAIKNNNKFIHYTFREYFLGIFLAYCVEILRNDKKSLKAISDVTLHIKNEFALYIFDMALSHNIKTCKIFREITKYNIESVNYYTEEDLRKCDLLGRGLFYYALRFRCIDTLKILIRKNISLNFEPFFLNFFEEWRSKNEGHHLSYFNHKSPDSLDEMHQLNSCYREIMLYILKKTDKETCPQVLKGSVNLLKECELRHWEIIDLIIDKFHYRFENFLEFEEFLSKVKKFNCPLETLIIVLFKSIEISKLSKIEQLKIRRHISRLADYKGTDEFLFGGEENLLNAYLKQCQVSKASITKLLFSDLIANYVREVSPFFIECKETTLQFSDYISKIKKRSFNFSIIVKHFLINGIKVFNFDFQKYKTALIERWNKYYNNCYLQTLKDISIKDFQCLECPDKFNKEDMFNIIQEYMPKINIDENTTVYEATTAIVTHILETSEGVKLLNLTYNFQNAVLDRDLSRTAKYFKETKELGFLDVISEAHYAFGDKAEQMLDDFEGHVHQRVNSMVEEIDNLLTN